MSAKEDNDIFENEITIVKFLHRYELLRQVAFLGFCLYSAFAECYATPLKYYLIISFVSRQVTSLLMHGISAVSVLSVGLLCILRIRATKTNRAFNFRHFFIASLCLPWNWKLRATVPDFLMLREKYITAK